MVYYFLLYLFPLGFSEQLAWLTGSIQWFKKKIKITTECLYQRVDIGEVERERTPTKSGQKVPRLLFPYAN